MNAGFPPQWKESLQGEEEVAQQHGQENDSSAASGNPHQPLSKNREAPRQLAELPTEVPEGPITELGRKELHQVRSGRAPTGFPPIFDLKGHHVLATSVFDLEGHLVPLVLLCLIESILDQA